MRNVKLAAAIAVAVCVTLGLGGGIAFAHKSSSPYVCGYGKKAGKAGEIYIVLGIKPKSVGSLFCSEFNSAFKGKSVDVHHQLGDGVAYCKYRYQKKGLDVISVVFADQSAAGKAFCKLYHPKGWKKI